MVDNNYNELCEDIKLVFNKAHENATELESCEALKKELVDMYEAALAAKEDKEKLVSKLETDIDDTRQHYESKLVNLQQQIKISEDKLLIKEEYDNSLKEYQTLKDANEEIRQTNLQYEAKIKEFKSKIAKYKKVTELKNIKNEIAAEQASATAVGRFVEDKKNSRKKTQQEVKAIEQKKGKLLYDIFDTKKQIDKLDTDHFKRYETLRLEFFMQTNAVSQMDEYLSDKSKLSELLELQTEHDLMKSKIKIVKEESRKYEGQISDISCKISKWKQTTDSIKEESTNLLFQLSELKQTISGQEIKINELNTTLTDSQSSKQKIRDELKAELETLIKAHSDSYELKRKQFEEIQSRNKNKEEEIKRKQEDIKKLSLELDELNKSNEVATKNDLEMKKELKELENRYLQAERKVRNTETISTIIENEENNDNKTV
ncbi:protein FAM184A-like [Aethina tumida]|uniref:protein FAM184A-like n=1 Tax=Aethina tumida TaxID=116153 RepID=UPI002147AF0E|nr:protein FAM184A-like [Aethina tumida]